MKEEILNSIKKDYQYLKEKRKMEKQMMLRYFELENNELVQEYLTLKNKLQDSYYQLSDDELLEISFSGFSFYMDQTNEIYVCLGEVLLSDNDTYKRYMNVENEKDSFLIPVDQCDLFEKNHRVVHFCDNDYKYSIGKFRDVQLDFLKTSIDYNQEKAINKVLKKKY